tara:strand:+ start:2803 stop:2967 length:165 start_codon:yes stop_codon:yes gene_type:complete
MIEKYRVEQELNTLLRYIDACEANIVRYKAMGDEKAVKAAEGMIRDFQKVMETM